MSFKCIKCYFKEMKIGMGRIPKLGFPMRRWSHRTKSCVSPDQCISLESTQEGRWENLPPELLLDIMRRVESSEALWPARNIIVFCASVCKSWREATKNIVKTPEECGRITFPVSLKQPGPRDFPIQCFVKRDRESSTYYLYIGLTPSETEKDKLLLAAKRTRRALGTCFVISLMADNFSRGSSTYMGKLRSNFLGTKFTMYDNQLSFDETIHSRMRTSINSKQVFPKFSACNSPVGTISYELNILRTRGPRRMTCVMNSIPISSIQEGGSAPTRSSFNDSVDGPVMVRKELTVSCSSANLLEESHASGFLSSEPLILRNKPPRWHEQLQCWCLNFKGRVTVASVKNFQLVATANPSLNVAVAEQERVILQFGKIGKDIFTMDYRYPLSAFQAFSICLSSFDTKPACE